MNIKPELFLNPPVKYRPNPMTHVWPKKYHKEFIQMLKDYGFGGVVTNVYQSDGFTTNPQNIEEFKKLTKELKDNDMAFWLYDESGYPSGLGDGKVLEGHPELEAKGLYMHRQVTYEPKHMTYCLDAESDKIVWAARYPLDTPFVHQSFLMIDKMEPVPFTKDRVECDLNAKEALFVFCVKPAYEGSHCTHNICSYDRYINILNPDAVRRFIDLCYEPIVKAIPDAYRQAAAVFTDEPSLQTSYVRDYEVWPYALLPWVDTLPEAFEAEYGFSLLPYLPYLFEGTTDAYPIRIKFYNLVGKLIAKAYTGQLRQWCEAHGGKFSGHYLAEEMMADHARIYGNFLEVQKASSYPGIDVLACYPEGYYYNTAKYVQMVVRKKGTNGMMAECCPFDNVEIFDKDPVENMTGIMGLNYLAGVRVIHSYFEVDYSEYDDGKFRDYTPRDEEKFGKCRKYMNRAQASQFHAYVGRLGYMLDGLRNDCNTFIYYGIEDVQAKTKPSYTAEVGRAIEADQNTIPLMKAVYEAGFDFYYADKEDLVNAAESIPYGVPKISGCDVDTIIIPGLDVMYEEALASLYKLQKAGVKVMFLKKLPQFGSELSADMRKFSNAFSIHTIQDVLTHLKNQKVSFEATADGVMLIKARFMKDGHELYLIDNNSRRNAEVLLNHKEKKLATLYNPVNGEISPVKMGNTIEIPSFRGVFIMFE